MADESKEVEGVRILGAKEASELSSASPTKAKAAKKERSATKTSAGKEQTKIVELPHWSEAPTGEVPAAVVDDGDGWEALTASQPRIRVDQNDWNEADYDPSKTLMDEAFVAKTKSDDNLAISESDEEFEKQVAVKRISTNTGEHNVTKISTIPDSASRTPVEGEHIEHGRNSKTQKAKASQARLKRDKRPGSTPYESTGEDKEDVVTQSEISVLVTRSITGVVLAAIGIVCALLGAIPTLIFVAVLIGAMSLELSGAFRQIGAKPATFFIAVWSLFSVFAGYLVGDRSVALSAATFFVFASVWYLLGIVKARPVIGLGVSTLVFMYVGILGSFAGMILALQDQSGKSIGVFVLVSTAICVAANDTAAYIFGKFMGRTPLMPAISPNKTMEGTTAGIVASIIVGIFVAYSSSSNIWGDVKGGIILGTLVACASIFGDLVESMLKRDVGVKDFGNILPGHGGLMDRFDGFLFALPVAYYLALVFI